MEQRRGPGRPPIPPDQRVQVYSVPLKPGAIEMLRQLAIESNETQGELVARLLRAEEQRRHRRDRIVQVHALNKRREGDVGENAVQRTSAEAVFLITAIVSDRHPEIEVSFDQKHVDFRHGRNLVQLMVTPEPEGKLTMFRTDLRLMEPVDLNDIYPDALLELAVTTIVQWLSKPRLPI